MTMRHAPPENTNSLARLILLGAIFGVIASLASIWLAVPFLTSAAIAGVCAALVGSTNIGMKLQV